MHNARFVKLVNHSFLPLVYMLKRLAGQVTEYLFRFQYPFQSAAPGEKKIWRFQGIGLQKQNFYSMAVSNYNVIFNSRGEIVNLVIEPGNKMTEALSDKWFKA